MRASSWAGPLLLLLVLIGPPLLGFDLAFAKEDPPVQQGLTLGQQIFAALGSILLLILGWLTTQFEPIAKYINLILKEKTKQLEARIKQLEVEANKVPELEKKAKQIPQLEAKAKSAEDSRDAAAKARDEALNVKKQAEAEKQRAQAEKQAAEAELNKWRYPYPVKAPNRRNSIIVAGIGGSGKTTLIRSISVHEQSDKQTEEFEVYISSIGQSQGNEHRNTWLYMVDYKGQTLAQLLNRLREAILEEFSPVSYGNLSSLILVVDLVAPSVLANGEVPPHEEPDQDRIAEHLEAWNGQALEAVFAQFTNKLRYVVLFINKWDLITNNTEDARQQARDAYEPLVERLETRVKDINKGREEAEIRDCTFECFLGSAREGHAPLVLELIKKSITDK